MKRCLKAESRHFRLLQWIVGVYKNLQHRIRKAPSFRYFLWCTGLFRFQLFRKIVAGLLHYTTINLTCCNCETVLLQWVKTDSRYFSFEKLVTQGATQDPLRKYLSDQQNKLQSVLTFRNYIYYLKVILIQQNAVFWTNLISHMHTCICSI